MQTDPPDGATPSDTEPEASLPQPSPPMPRPDVGAPNDAAGVEGALGGGAAGGETGEKKGGGGTAASMLVAAGILLSRMAGLLRESVTAMFLGTSIYADALRAGIRLPNALQNLLGEGTLSASFIPVYSELIHEGREEEAGRLAGAVFAFLFAIAGALSLLGVLFAPVLVDLFLFGFEGERRELTIRVTRIIFPMTGVLVLSAWSLGILNSHRKFFIPYVAPVLWSAAIIGAFIVFGGRLEMDALVVAASWGALLGGALQFGVQLPWVLRLERSLKLGWGWRMESFRTVVGNAVPAIMGRGVVQLSGYADVFLASLLVAGSVSTITYALTLYMLPISLFGMSVAAAELPELSRQRAAATDELRRRASAGLERISFYVVPSFVALTLLGDVIVAMLLQRGEFDRSDTLWVWVTVAAFSLGLLATTTTRMLSSTFFALRDTRTPARAATIRVLLSITIAVVMMTQFETIAVDKWGLDLLIPAGIFAGVTVAGHTLGTVGLALGSGIAAWVEWIILKRVLRKRIGGVGTRGGVIARMFGAALAGAAAAWGVRLVLPEMDVHPTFDSILYGLPVVAAFGVTYFGVAAALGLDESRSLFARLGRLLGRGR